jgi:hypothetical protein
MNITHKKYIGAAAIATALIAVAALPAFAQTQTNQNSGPWQGRGPGMMAGNAAMGRSGRPGLGNMMPGISGTVSSISGTTLVVDGRAFGGPKPTTTTNSVGTKYIMATTTYSVDATNATVYKNNATSTLSSVAVGDRVFVQGTVSGTSVAATSIRDGLMMFGHGNGTTGKSNTPGTMMNGGQNQTPPIKGNGQPVVAGTVSTVSGTSVVITTLSNTSYTVDVSSTTVNKNGTPGTASSIAVGDYVVVQGTVNGSSVTASSVIDSQTPPANSSAPDNNLSKPAGGYGMGFFGSIGGFFKKLFGF